MKNHLFARWFRAVACILILFGLAFVVFGLRIFSDTVRLVPRHVLLPWESALYGAIMVGWGTTLFVAGRLAFRWDDRELKNALLIGLAVWLTLEAAASAWFGVWFNVGVDIVVFALFAIPLFRQESRLEKS